MSAYWCAPESANTGTAIASVYGVPVADYTAIVRVHAVGGVTTPGTSTTITTTGAAATIALELSLDGGSTYGAPFTLAASPTPPAVAIPPAQLPTRLASGAPAYSQLAVAFSPGSVVVGDSWQWTTLVGPLGFAAALLTKVGTFAAPTPTVRDANGNLLIGSEFPSLNRGPQSVAIIPGKRTTGEPHHFPIGRLSAGAGQAASIATMPRIFAVTQSLLLQVWGWTYAGAEALTWDILRLIRQGDLAAFGSVNPSAGRWIDDAKLVRLGRMLETSIDVESPVFAAATPDEWATTGAAAAASWALAVAFPPLDPGTTFARTTTLDLPDTAPAVGCSG